MRFRKSFNPTGSKEFFHTLSKLNVPKDLVRNEARWKEVLSETSGTPKSFLSALSEPQKGEKRGYDEYEIVLILEQNIRVFLGLHKLTHRSTFGKI